MLTIAVIDSETLKLDPKHPEKVMVDEAGVAVFTASTQSICTATIDKMLEKAFDGIRPGEAIITGHHDMSINIGLFKLPLIEQLLAGREASRDTVEWHQKRGYNPELETRTMSVAGAMACVKKFIVDADIVYCRGQDFDFPLLNSLLEGDETICQHRKAGDIRTAFDALLMDGQVGLLTDERLAESPLFRNDLAALTVAKKINAFRKELGHRATNDAMLDLLMLLLLRYQQWLLLERLNPPTAVGGASLS
jgi:hypothetical protein